MNRMVSIKRDKEDILGLVEFLENGFTKFARFPKGWNDEKVCEVFGIEKAIKKESAK